MIFGKFKGSSETQSMTGKFETYFRPGLPKVGHNFNLEYRAILDIKQ